MRVDQLLQMLAEHRPSGKGQYMAKCPAHEDKRRSLAVSQGRNGGTLIYCHAGCSTDDVLVELGLKSSDLMPDNSEPPKPRIVAQYDYRDEHGDLLYQVLRMDPKGFRQRRPDGNGGWSWSVSGVRKVLYRLPEVINGDSKGVVVVEGEKDADRLWGNQITATTISGGAGKPVDKSILTPLAGRDVVIVPDNDDPGREWAMDICRCLRGVARSAAVLELDVKPKGDISDWLETHSVCDLHPLLRESVRGARPDTMVSMLAASLTQLDDIAFERLIQRLREDRSK